MAEGIFYIPLHHSPHSFINCIKAKHATDGPPFMKPMAGSALYKRKPQENNVNSCRNSEKLCLLIQSKCLDLASTSVFKGARHSDTTTGGKTAGAERHSLLNLAAQDLQPLCIVMNWEL